jgi:diguanylate cyclase (GGDEF)-like protein
MVEFAKFIRRICAGGLAILAMALPAHAAVAERWAALVDTVFTHLGQGSELPASTDVSSIAEDGDGFLWVGSQMGLARWDGYHFRIYRPSADIPDALPDNYVTELHTDPKGRLWIGTNSGGLALHDSDRDRFIVYGAGADGLSHGSVNAIADDGAGGLWVGTVGGIDHLDPATGVVRHLRHDANDSASLPNDRVLALRLDRSGTLWVGTSGGLARLARGANGFSTISLPSKSGEIPQVSALLEDSAGRMWIGTKGNGAYVIDAGESTARLVQETRDGAPSTLANEVVRAMEEIRAGVVWIATDAQGIVAVDTVGFRTHRIRHDPALPSSLGDGAVFAIHRDRAGLVWVGTDRSLSRHNAAQTTVSTIFGASSRKDSVSVADVAAVLEMPNGLIWLGLGNNGIDVIDPAGVRVAALRPNPEQPERALPRKYVTALAATNADVYIGTRQGLYRADSAARGVVRVSVPERLPADDVSTLLNDDGVLWVGGNGGLRGLDLGGSNAAARMRFATTAKLTDQRVSVLSRGSDGVLWVGTENGLNRLDFTSLTVEHITADRADSQALPLGYISSLLIDRRGRLWVGTLGGGIGVLRVDDRNRRARFRRLGLAQGLGNNTVDQLLEDAHGRIWASTDDGIAVIDPDTLAIRVLQNPDGVAILVHWAPAGARTSAGELLFGGAGGLTLIRPDRLEDWSYRPPIVITNVRVGGKLIEGSRFNTPLAAAPLTIVPDANSVAVEFAALDYSAPERNRYAYRLEGYDKDWVETDANQRMAAYTNLAPGNYVLRLRGSNRNGEWVERTVPVPIHVLPAWFQTFGFRILLGLTGLALLAGLMHIRTTYLRHRQRELERQIAERTASLNQRTEELQESQRQLELIAYFDTLTRLPNRRRFKDEMGRLISRMQGADCGFALMLIDLDRFKQINDTLGHEAGDRLLQEAAGRFKTCVRESDVLARLGGDEFVLLLPDADRRERAAIVARELLAAIGRPFALAGHEFRVTASIGISIYPHDGVDEQTLMKHADIAMYQAKAEGKNNFQFYSDALNRDSLERLTLESSLRHALERNELQLHYQAQWDIATGQMSGVAALLRWQHPELGRVAPVRFIPVAEETGLMVPIGKWVLRTACRQNVAWQKQGLPRLNVAVNLTARQFADDRLLEDIASILAETGMDARLLELEVAESLLIRDVEKTRRILTALKSMGIRLAIDDFGAGYASLTTLQQFPLDAIKIDRSFIRDITNVSVDNELTDAVIAMGRSLSLTVVAQGIETRDQAEFLRQHACDELQGFYFNRPLPAEQFEQLLQAQAAGTTYVGERSRLQNAK